jgi:hypothetical protein
VGSESQLGQNTEDKVERTKARVIGKQHRRKQKHFQSRAPNHRSEHCFHAKLPQLTISISGASQPVMTLES